MQQPLKDDRDMRARRLRLGLTLRDLAKRCAAEGAPVDHSQLGKIERGLVRDPRPQTRAALGRILGLDPLEIGARADGQAGKAAPSTDVDVQQVRDKERAQSDGLPELRR
jgi:transcriptional regulator with XRE-family HTH domain